jgi:hypothetical protein
MPDRTTQPQTNISQNIIAGPGPNVYWNHSPGAEQPEVREQGPFPIYGNIGSLIGNEGRSYTTCANNGPKIGSGPNCSNSFVPDIYTKDDTCGDECLTKYPESFGLKDFAFPDNMNWTDKVTNSHQVHSYQNLRSSFAGQGPSATFGPSEWVPKLSTDVSRNVSVMNPEKAYAMVGNWLDIPAYANLKYGTYSDKI